jgi:PadR family transcriptional regulator, regulatory protein PadR
MGKTSKPEMPRLSYQGLLVLRVFLDRPRKELCGADLMRLTNLASGTLYPILLRFERYEMLESDWEDMAPEEVGRPRRRLYKITPHGAQVARQMLDNFTNVLSQAKLSPDFATG